MKKFLVDVILAVLTSEQVKDLLGEVLGRIIRENLPPVVTAAVQAGVKAGTELASDGVDKLTDLVPGTLDDRLIDPIVRNVLDEFRKVFGL